VKKILMGKIDVTGSSSPKRVLWIPGLSLKMPGLMKLDERSRPAGVMFECHTALMRPATFTLHHQRRSSAGLACCISLRETLTVVWSFFGVGRLN
jgi:hypothetical protein